MDSPDPLNQQPALTVAAVGELEQGELLLERYRIIERVAKGGLSIVYRAQDERLARPVCIKLFHISWWDECTYRASYDLFIQEAFALSQLTHPNTLRILDFGYVSNEASGGKDIPFQVSEYMNAGTLSQLVRHRGPFSSRTASHIVKYLCGPLAEAHSLGIIHRDIKPQNILFGRAGPSDMIKLADFGIATLLRSAESSWPGLQPQSEARSMLVFSRSWAAPEQLRGGEVTPSTDIYSLGLLIVFMLSGQIVFQSTDPTKALDLRRQSDELLWACLSQQQLAADKIDFLRSVCSYDPDRRPSDIASFKTVFFNLFAPQEAAQNLSRHPTERMAELFGGERCELSRELCLPVCPAMQEPPCPAERPEARRTDLQRCVSPEPCSEQERLQFVSAPQGSIDLLLQDRARVRLSFLQRGGGSYLLHLQGLNCFVSKAGQVPTPALQLSGSETVTFVSAGRSPLARARVVLRSASGGAFPLEVRDAAAGLEASPNLPTATLDPGQGYKLLVIFPKAATQAAQQARPAGLLGGRHESNRAKS